MSESTAILFFTRSGQEEIQHKTFHSNHQTAYRVAEHLIKRTRTVLQAANYPVFEVDSAKQQGITPNARFDSAMNLIFEQGFEKIIAVGNDCPQLTTSDIKKAADLLETRSLVLGPDLRGGTYLFAIRKSEYKSQLVLSLPWGSSQFLNRMLHQMDLQQVAFLDTLSDVNGLLDDLQKAATQIRKALLKAFLLLFYPDQPSSNNLTLSTIEFRVSRISRGPPQY